MADAYAKKIDEIISDIENLIQNGVCKYSTICNGWDKNSYTCNHAREALRYCGKHREHDSFVQMIELKQNLNE